MSEQRLPALRGVRLLLVLALGVGGLLLGGKLLSTLTVETLWQAQAGYAGVFWKRVTWEYGTRVLAGVAVAGLLFLNLRVVAGTLGGIHIKRRFGNLEISEQLPRRYVFWSIAGASGLLGLWFGAAVPRNLGIQVLLLFHQAGWGLQDPVLGHDLSFYVFWIPVLGSVLTFALIAVFMTFSLVAAGYSTTGAVRWGKGRIVIADGSRLHLGNLLAVFLVLLGARIWLSRYLLLLSGNSPVQGIFGFTDAQARLPALQTLAVICILAAGGTLWGSLRKRGGVVVAALGSVVAAAILIGQLYPAVVQRFRVEPNELQRETPYIEYNLEFTRRGFGLDRLERRRFPYRAEAPVDWNAAATQFAGLPVWSRGALLTTFRQLEARFPYYDFTDVSVDRYPTPDGLTTVALSVRELDPGGIQDPNWQNLHLRERYVVGMGAVAVRASHRTAEGRAPTILSGIPPEFTADAGAPEGLRLTRPDVFFGFRPQLYAVVSPSDEQFLAPDGTPGQAGVDFPPGIAMGSTLRTLALAWRFRDANLLFASEISDRSRFIYRRRVVDRVRAVAPFLRFPEAPYPVISGGRIVWVLEGFTATRAFPLSIPHGLPLFRPATYVRNSVKVTVDGISGKMRFYRVPVDDPLLDAFGHAFPGLLTDLDQMPEDLRQHLRYSRELLSLQAQVLLQYHQETAPAFHGQQDVWNLPQELAQGTSPVPYRPEYGLYRLPGEQGARFNLTAVFVPAGRQNLTAILVARADSLGRPELVQFDVPVEDQVPGPRQIEALVEQDPQISQQFSLWRTGGSEVWTGHLHLVPAGDRLVYMEPVFLAAAADAIPELRRFVVSDGRRVAMTESLDDAIRALSGIQGAISGVTPESPAAALPSVDVARWPREALDLLRRADDRLRDGDWVGFGQAWDELRALLERLGRGGG